MGGAGWVEIDLAGLRLKSDQAGLGYEQGWLCIGDADCRSLRLGLN
jgi:hypothetical protein